MFAIVFAFVNVVLRKSYFFCKKPLKPEGFSFYVRLIKASKDLVFMLMLSLYCCPYPNLQVGSERSNHAAFEVFSVKVLLPPR